MTLEALYFIAQIVAALAIIGSLVFVGLQVRAQTAEQTARRFQDRAALTATLNRIIIDKADTRRVLIKANQGLSGLSEEEMALFNSFQRQLLLLAQVVFASTPKGQLPDRSAAATLTRALLMPGSTEFWGVLKTDYAPDFIEFVESLRAWGKAEGLDRRPFAMIQERDERTDDA